MTEPNYRKDALDELSFNERDISHDCHNQTDPLPDC
jgi:hypothetical protein